MKGLSKTPLTAAQQQLVVDHRPLAVDFAMRVARGTPHFDDVLSEAYLGLMRSTIDFDPAKGCFSTHAYPWIRHRVLRYVQDRLPIVRVPVHMRYPRKGVTRSQYVEQARRIINSHAISFSDCEHALCAADNGLSDFEARSDDMAWLAREIERLSESERRVIRRQLAGETLREIAVEFGLTYQRIQQISQSARDKLKAAASAVMEDAA